MSLVYAHNGAELENISFSIGVFAQLSSFVSVIVCTVMLVRALAQNSRSVGEHVGIVARDFVLRVVGGILNSV